MSDRLILDPVVIAQLGNLQLKARRVLDGLYSGAHMNSVRGHNQDFSEHRPYHPGDDLRSLDWKVFGRTDRLVVRQYEEQTNIAAWIVLDSSASMNFSSGPQPSKLEYSKVMAATIGTMIIGQHDAVGLWSPDLSLPPRSQRDQFEQCIQKMEALEARGIWNVSGFGKTLGALMKRKSFIILFTDLMTNFEELLAQLQILSSLRNEIILFHVMDSAEWDLPYQGEIIFEDMETSQKIHTEPHVIRSDYQAWLGATFERMEKSLQSLGIDYCRLFTRMSFDQGLGRYLAWRMSRI